MKNKKRLLLAMIAISSVLSASEIDTAKLYEVNCVACHVTDVEQMKNKASLIAPPADEIMQHMKEEFPDKAKAVQFMAEYILAPDPKKTLCASIETFGLMPALKGVISMAEAEAVSSMMYEKYPRDAFVEAEVRGRMTFEKLDVNANGSITAKEYQLFRATKNNIDPSKFVNSFYFDRLDLNGDGKMDRTEYDKMREDKRRKKRR